MVSLSLMIVDHSLLLQLIFQTCLIVSLIASYGSWTQLFWQKVICDKGRWVLIDRNQREITAEWLQFYQFGLFWIVRFRPMNESQPRVITIPLTPDNCDADEFRRLRQLLLHA
jgi:hypothetical protein